MSKQMNTLPAKQTVVGAIVYPTILFSYMAKHRMVTFVVVTLLILTAIIGTLAVRGIMNADAQLHSPKVLHAEGTNMTTTTNLNNQPLSDSGMPNASTNVMVNGQSIPVPNNGSVSRTITNGNGTTQVDISNHSSSSGTNNSSTSTNLSINSSTYSKDIHAGDSP